MTLALTLGDVIFSDFEIPEALPFGGDQIRTTHKMPGGNRTIDAMGRDQADIEWSGRFRGGLAETRAKRLDYLRVQGNPLLLTWSTFRYTVLIASFWAEYRQSYEIPYRIVCEVVSDEYDAANRGVAGLDELFSADLSEALNLSNGLALSALVSAVGTIQETTQAIQALKDADQPTLIAIQSAITAAQSLTQTAIGADNATVAANGSVGGISPLQSAAINANSLVNQASAFAQLGQLYQLNSLLGRMSVNLSHVGL